MYNASPGPGQPLSFFCCYCSYSSFTCCCCHCMHLFFTQVSFLGLPFHHLSYFMHWLNPHVSFQHHRILLCSAEAFLPCLNTWLKWAGISSVPICCFPLVANKLNVLLTSGGQCEYRSLLKLLIVKNPWFGF